MCPSPKAKSPAQQLGLIFIDKSSIQIEGTAIMVISRIAFFAFQETYSILHYNRLLPYHGVRSL